MTKTEFGKKWSAITNKYRCGNKILGSDRDFILQACNKTETYFTNASKSEIRVVIRMIPIANGRKVRMICLEAPGVRQPISKGKVLEQAFPKRTRKTKKVSSGSESKVRSSMRFLVEDQIKAFRKRVEYPILCPVSGHMIKKGRKVDVDHLRTPFVQIADEFLLSKGLVYDDIKLKGPVNAKVFVDEQLQEDWIDWHKEKATLAIVLSSFNRSKGCEDYSSPHNVYVRTDPIDILDPDQL